MSELQSVSSTETEEFIRADEFRRQISEKATLVAESGRAVNIGMKSAKPVYRLDPIKDLPKEVVDRAMPMRVDDARKTWRELRALLLAGNGDAYFAIVVKGMVKSILRLHPEHKLKLVPRYRAFMHEKRGDANPG